MGTTHSIIAGFTTHTPSSTSELNDGRTSTGELGGSTSSTTSIEQSVFRPYVRSLELESSSALPALYDGFPSPNEENTLPEGKVYDSVPEWQWKSVLSSLSPVRGWMGRYSNSLSRPDSNRNIPVLSTLRTVWSWRIALQKGLLAPSRVAANRVTATCGNNRNIPVSCTSTAYGLVADSCTAKRKPCTVMCRHHSD